MTIAPTSRRAVRLAIDEPRLLRALGRFFHSFENSCEELVQNADRAGARSIHDNVLWLSAGIEDSADLIADLDRALPDSAGG